MVTSAGLPRTGRTTARLLRGIIVGNRSRNTWLPDRPRHGSSGTAAYCSALQCGSIGPLHCGRWNDRWRTAWHRHCCLQRRRCSNLTTHTGTKRPSRTEDFSMKKVVAGLAALVFAAPLVASAQTTRPADQPVRDTRDTKAPAWKQTGLHESKDIIGTRIKSTAGKDLGEVDQLLIDRSGR